MSEFLAGMSLLSVLVVFSISIAKLIILYLNDKLHFNFSFFLTEEQKQNKKAEEAREAVLNSYYREFLAYGFSKEEAMAFATKKLKTEAFEASGLGKEGFQSNPKSANRV